MMEDNNMLQSLETIMEKHRVSIGDDKIFALMLVICAFSHNIESIYDLDELLTKFENCELTVDDILKNDYDENNNVKGE